jgi:NADH dehydrogenase
MRPSYFGHDEFARYAPGLKSLTDAETIRAKILGAIELAVTTEDENERARIDDNGVIAGGKRIPSATVVWTAGVAASPVPKNARRQDRPCRTGAR